MKQEINKVALHVKNVQFAYMIVIFFGIFLTDMWRWYSENHESLTTQSAAVYSSLVLLIAGSLKMALTSFLEHEKNGNTIPKND